MKKKKGERGTGVTMSELTLAADNGSSDDYFVLLLRCAVEKLKCIGEESKDPVALDIINREEFLQ